MTGQKVVRRRRQAASMEGVRKTVALSITGLQKAGAFTGRPVRKEIVWTQGSVEYDATVFVRPIGYQSMISDVMTAAGKQDGIAGRIAASICDEDGAAVFTVADIIGQADKSRGPLDGNLTMALLQVIHEVNSLGKTTS